MNRGETLSNNSFYAAQNSASQVWWYQGSCRISLGILGAKQHSTDTAVELCKSTLHLVRVYRKILFEFRSLSFYWICVSVYLSGIWFWMVSCWNMVLFMKHEVDFNWLLWECAFSALQAIQFTSLYFLYNHHSIIYFWFLFKVLMGMLCPFIIMLL